MISSFHLGNAKKLQRIFLPIIASRDIILGFATNGKLLLNLSLGLSAKKGPPGCIVRD